MASRLNLNLRQTIKKKTHTLLILRMPRSWFWYSVGLQGSTWSITCIIVAVAKTEERQPTNLESTKLDKT